MIRKVVVPAAGLGTRLFPATKEQPKEMLPIFSKTTNGDIAVKPLLQMVFEQLHDTGYSSFSNAFSSLPSTFSSSFAGTIIENLGSSFSFDFGVFFTSCPELRRDFTPAIRMGMLYRLHT